MKKIETTLRELVEAPLDIVEFINENQFDIMIINREQVQKLKEDFNSLEFNGENVDYIVCNSVALFKSRLHLPKEDKEKAIIECRNNVLKSLVMDGIRYMILQRQQPKETN